MTEFLNPTELHQLTGFARHSSQASWLLQHSSPKLTERHYRTKSTKLKAVR